MVKPVVEQQRDIFTINQPNSPSSVLYILVVCLLLSTWLFREGNGLIMGHFHINFLTGRSLRLACPCTLTEVHAVLSLYIITCKVSDNTMNCGPAGKLIVGWCLKLIAKVEKYKPRCWFVTVLRSQVLTVSQCWVVCLQSCQIKFAKCCTLTTKSWVISVILHPYMVPNQFIMEELVTKLTVRAANKARDVLVNFKG